MTGVITELVYNVAEMTLLTLLTHKRNQVTFKYLIRLYGSDTIRSRSQVVRNTFRTSHA